MSGHGKHHSDPHVALALKNDKTLPSRSLKPGDEASEAGNDSVRSAGKVCAGSREHRREARGTRLGQRGQASLKGHRRRAPTELASPRKFPGRKSCSCTENSDSID